MGGKNIKDIFEKFMTKESIFLDRTVLSDSYTPEDIPHREEQINQIAHILKPSLKMQKASNIFIYGQPGTGKTLSVKYVTNNLEEVARQQNIPLKVIYTNCKLKRIANTEYRLIADIARHLGKAIPPTGLPTDEVYRIFFDALKEKERNIILILDEVDEIVNKAKDGDNILYNLSRINTELKTSKVSLIGITNSVSFSNEIDSRTKSSLSEEEVVFPVYNAMQLKDILVKRAKLAFQDDCLGEGVIQKAAAFAARDHGDARRALELLRVAGEIAEREDNKTVLIKHVDRSEDKIERDKVFDIIETQPQQFQAVFFSIMKISRANKKRDDIFTGEIYNKYARVCSDIKMRPLTQRRISDILMELDTLGLINARVISNGRYGRTKNISLSTPDAIEEKIVSALGKKLGLR